MDELEKFNKFCEDIIFDHPALDMYEDGSAGLTHSNCVNVMRIAYLKALMEYSIWADYVPGGNIKFEKLKVEYDNLMSVYEDNSKT